MTVPQLPSLPTAGRGATFLPTSAAEVAALLEVDPPGYLGLAGEPVRGQIERTLLVRADRSAVSR